MKARDKGKAGRPAERGGTTGAGDKGWRFDLLAVGVLLLATLLFFGDFVFSNGMLFGTDTIPTGYMARKIYGDFLRTHGTVPLWNPYIVGGLPFIDALHGDALYPASVVNGLLPVHRAMGWKLVLHVFLAGVSMYAFLRTRNVRRMAAGVAGLGYAFAPYLVSLIYAGHDGKLYVTALLPLAFAGLEKGLRTRRPFAFLMMGGVVGLLFLTSHVQMTAYALWGLGLYLVADLVQHRAERSPGEAARSALWFVAGIAVGVGVGLVQFLPAFLYTRAYSPRAGGVSFEYATSWSLHPEEVISLIVPQFVHYQDPYWGRNAFKLNCEAPGLILLLLAGAGLFLRWSRRTVAIFLGAVAAYFLCLVTASVFQWVFLVLAVAGFLVCVSRSGSLAFFLLLAVFALFYSVGAHTPLYWLFYHVIPGVKFFRAPSTVMMLFLFATACLAGHGADRVQSIAGSPDARRVVRGLVLSAAVGVGILVAVAAARGPLVRLWSTALFPDLGERRSLLEANYGTFVTWTGVAVLLVALAALVVWAIAAGRARPALGMGAIGALVLASVWPVDRDFVHTVRVEDFVVSDPAIQAMQQDKTLFRVLPLTGNSMYDRNYLPIFGLQTLNGFHDNRLRVYDEITGEGRLTQGRILDLYNTKYVVTSQAVSSPVFEPVLSAGTLRLYRNRAVLPRAFVAFGYEVVPDAPAALERLMSPEFDYRSTLLLDRPPEAVESEPGRPPVEARVLEYGPNRIRVATDTDRAALLFLGDNYFPYWRAKVDGRAASVLRCDYAFRAVPVPAGRHEVVLRYRSNPLLVGAVVSGMCAALVLGCLVFHGIGRVRGRRACA